MERKLRLEMREDFEEKKKEADNNAKKFTRFMQDTDEDFLRPIDRINMRIQKKREVFLEIHNVPETPSENLEDIIFELAKLFNIELNKDNIVEVIRDSSQVFTFTYPILVQFTDKEITDEFLKNKEKVITQRNILKNESNDRVYITQSLSSVFSQLLWKTKLYLGKKFQYIWYENYSVLLQKDDSSEEIVIRDETELHDLVRELGNKEKK